MDSTDESYLLTLAVCNTRFCLDTRRQPDWIPVSVRGTELSSAVAVGPHEVLHVILSTLSPSAQERKTNVPVVTERPCYRIWLCPSSIGISRSVVAELSDSTTPRTSTRSKNIVHNGCCPEFSVPLQDALAFLMPKLWFQWMLEKFNWTVFHQSQSIPCITPFPTSLVQKVFIVLCRDS